MGQGHPIFSVSTLQNSDMKENRTWGTPTLSSWLSRYKGVEEMMSHPPVNSYSHSIIIVFAICSTVHNCHLSLYLILKYPCVCFYRNYLGTYLYTFNGNQLSAYSY